MKLILSIVIATLATVALAQQIDRESVATAEVTRYVEHWARSLPQRFRKRALSHVPSVAHWSVHYDLDPLLVAVQVSTESSWDHKAIGAKGEVGLMQLHNRESMAGCDMRDSDEQVRCGCRWLRKCIDECHGSIYGGIAKYTTGKCAQAWSKLGIRVRRWRKAIRRFRK